MYMGFKTIFTNGNTHTLVAMDTALIILHESNSTRLRWVLGLIYCTDTNRSKIIPLQFLEWFFLLEN
jgi:hypothetical protein